jgi:tetratricopeptide (TPR) repeat protein
MKWLQLWQLAVPLLCFLIIIIGNGCQSNKPANSPTLSSIELLRGDIALCGNPEFGEVSFTLSCNYSVRKTFDLAVSLLHSFEHEEAEKQFAKVLDIDPECAMAYWGLAMCKIGHPKFLPDSASFEQGSKILEVAASMPKTIREQEYLNAVGAYYAAEWGTAAHKSRSKKMELQMEQIYERYEEDKEAAILYALTLFTTADPEDKTYTARRKAGKILETIFENQPNHPGIAHYIIHNYDAPGLAHLGLFSARRYAQIAPASAHAQHMPSHIFTRLGLWQESIESNISSASAARCYAEEVEMDGHWGNEIHALDYLVYAYLQMGDNRSAHELNEYFKTITKVVSQYDPYNFVAIPARIVLENKQWAEAADLKIHDSEYRWEDSPWVKALINFTRALGAARSGSIKTAESELEELKKWQSQLEKTDQYKAKQVIIQVKASQAWIQYGKGNKEEALKLMRESADMEDSTEKHPITPGELLPARELLGDMLMELNKPEEALEAYESDLKKHPDRFNGIYGAATAAQQIGDETRANMYFNRLLELTAPSDSDRPEVVEAKNFLTSNI